MLMSELKIIFQVNFDVVILLFFSKVGVKVIKNTLVKVLIINYFLSLKCCLAYH